MDDSRQIKNLSKRVWSYAWPYRRRILLSMLASLGVASTDGAMAKLVQPFIDKLIIAGDRDLIQLVPLIVIGLAAFKGLSRYVQQYYILTAGQLAIQDLRNQVFKHLMSLSMRFHSSNGTGSIMSRVLNDIGMLQAFLGDVLVIILRESFTLVVLVGLAFYTDWKMALIAFTALPATALPAALLARRIKAYVKKSQGAIAVLTTALEQAFSGIKVIKSFGTEKDQVRRFFDKNRSYYNFWRKVIKYDAASSPVTELLTSLGVAGVLWYGLNRVLAGEMTQGQLFSIVAAILMMYGPVKRLVRVNNVFQSAMGAAERVFELFEAQPEILDAENAVRLDRVRGELVLDHVCFSYDTASLEPVIRDLSLTIKPGEMVALVGPSGSGKTTLMGLLLRFFDPDSGSIRLDGHDLREISAESLHRNMAMVDQEAFLFNDTIANNISYGSAEGSLDRVREAARQAYADGFIEELPDGYQTEIGDRGLRLSGGQRQRISIARAVYQNAPVLILDEATSALDTESEAIVQEALNNLVENRTTIVIAHRLSTVKHADRIVVLDKGTICEIGTHEELLARGGMYRRLHDMQFKEDTDGSLD
ncbi:lipid A export permease/ATP-binding protein MsbA [Geothermobacter hydrogeniphilus]|nr:lipid A export permease/ATP-binding protein MsbA [Geothermobacter hydrogeniphilus]